MHRRDALKSLLTAIVLPSAWRAERRGAVATRVSTLIGTGAPGFSDRAVNNPYGLALGPDGALYFCDLDNQRIRRFDLSTRRTSTVGGVSSIGLGSSFSLCFSSRTGFLLGRDRRHFLVARKRRDFVDSRVIDQAGLGQVALV